MAEEQKTEFKKKCEEEKKKQDKEFKLKLKEKKEKLIADVFTCLDSIMTHCLSLDEVVDDLHSFIFNEKDKSITLKQC